MEELEFSLMQRGNHNEEIQPILNSFQEKNRAHAALQILDWGQARGELIRAALYHHGPDVSEVGTSWVSDLVAMNALRPFSDAEVDAIGVPNSFLPAAWKTTHLVDDPQVWAIPWLTEAFLLHYRRDLLKAAGIDETCAFDTPERLFETVQTLKQAGYMLPIAVPPRSTRAMILHVAATWVWQQGGEFLHPDGRQVSFTSPEALAGFQAYFHLLRSISLEGIRTLDEYGIPAAFLRGYTPMVISGPWLNPRTAPAGSIDEKNWGIARLPGPSFVGGTNLVIWKHTRAERLALALVRHLANPHESSRYGDPTGMLSARTSALSTSQYQEERFIQLMYEAIQKGRSYPTIALWGLVEDRLVTTLSAIWDSLINNPQLDVDETVAQSLSRVARSLNLTLSQR